MRNSFGSKQKDSAEFRTEITDNNAVQADSPDQTAIVWDGDREVVSVSPLLNQASNSYDIDFARLPADSNIAATLDSRRANQPKVPPVSGRTLFLTVVPDFSERTRILALDGNILSLKNAELLDWLINAERQMYVGTDSHPIFETALEETACFINRLPNGLVSMTEVPRQHVETIRNKINYLTEGRSQNLVVETQLRSVARYFLTSQPEGEDILSPGKEHEATAFLIVTGAGFSFGLWSPATGLFSEYAFPAPAEIQTIALRLARQRAAETANPQTVDELRQDDHLMVYIRQAFDQLFLQLSPEKLEQMELTSYAQAVWITEPGLVEKVDKIATEYSSTTGLEFIEIKAPLAEAVAGGLLLGSFTFGESRVIGADIIEPVNLARDILVLADKEELNRRQVEEFSYQKQRTGAAFAFWAAPVLALACLLALAFNIFRHQAVSGIREARADSKAAELKPAVDRRKSYEANLKWYEEFIKQVSALRRQQPVGTNLLYELNANYPLAVDPSFYIAEMKLNLNGGVEIKGFAKNKDAITSFLRSLEFAGGVESGKKLFSNLTYEVREGVETNTVAGGTTLPTMAGSTLTSSNPAPGVIAWNIKGNYLPVVEFAPPDPNKKPAANAPPVAPNANANTAGQSPAATPNQGAANVAK